MRTLFSGPTRGPTNLKSFARRPGSTAPKSEASSPRARPVGLVVWFLGVGLNQLVGERGTWLVGEDGQRG